MRKITVFIILIIVLLSTQMCIYAKTPDKNSDLKEKKVLCISSYSYSWESVYDQIIGLWSEVEKSAKIDYKFMSSESVYTKVSERLFYNDLSYFIKNQPKYDVVVLEDEIAFDFGLKYREELFGDIPIVFASVTEGNKHLETAKKDSSITGVVEKISYNKTIEYACSLYPKAKNIVAITDRSTVSEKEKQAFCDVIPKYIHLNFRNINSDKYSKEELRQEIQKLDENSILIYISCGRDKDSKYTAAEGADFVCKNAKIPVFTISKKGIESGMLGGEILSQSEIGKETGEIVNEILAGKSISDIPIKVNQNRHFYINEKTLKRFGVSHKVIPENANIINHEKTFFEVHSEFIRKLTVATLLVLFLISLYLMIRNRQQKKINKKLNYNLKYDTLTNIYNRAVFSEDLQKNIQKAAPFAILMYDLDNFKHINDVYGHNEGDAVLKELAQRVSELNDDIFRVYRLAGDEFMAIIKSNDYELVAKYAKSIQKQMQKPFMISGEEHTLHSSIGVAVWPMDGKDATTLVASADKAMYYVKKHGKGDVEFFCKYIQYDEQMKMLQEMDKSELESRIFDGFARTSNRRYLFICNMHTKVTRLSSGAIEFFGLSGEYLVDAMSELKEKVHPDDSKKFLADVKAVFAGKTDRNKVDYRVRSESGEYVICTIQSLVIKGEEGKPDLYIGTIENHSIVDNVDPVTNLYNNVEFGKTLDNWKENSLEGTVLLLGVRNFSDVNKNYGYTSGDKILKLIAMKMQQKIGEKGRLYRMEGVTFAICSNIKAKREIRNLFSEIVHAMHHEIYLGNTRIAIHVSGGAVIADYDFARHSILTSARYAMEHSKYNNIEELVYFDNKLFGKNKRNLKLLAELRECVLHDCEGFYLCYQPLISAKTEKIIGAEALIRWHKEPIGSVSPEVFMPWLENDPIFAELGNWILRKALSQGKQFVKHDPEFVLNVNITYSQISRPQFKWQIKDLLEELNFPAENLCMELTERCRQLDKTTLKTEIGYFKSLGIKIAIDDFGTGYSSLNLLSALSVDTLKFDKGFTQDLETNVVNQNIIQAITECADKMKINVCLEGMESREMIDFSKKYSVYSYQGFYFSEPITYDSFVENYCYE